MFCKHKWKILSETLHKSKAEYANTLGFRSSGISFDFDRVLIQVLTCEKCGKLKRYKETI